MTRDDLREQIAIEAARLLLRGKVNSIAMARKRAARWLKRQRLHRDEVPSNQEIQVQMYALSGLMASERDPMHAAQICQWLSRFLQALEIVSAVWINPRVLNEWVAGAELLVAVQSEASSVRALLTGAGYRTRRLPLEASTPASVIWRMRVEGQCPCELRGYDVQCPWPPTSDAVSLSDLQAQWEGIAVPLSEPPDDEHPDAFGVFAMLLEPLARVMLPAETHPEGDALYHSLQVFELGRQVHPYDEEFLLACLLHDVGWGINPRHPVLSALDALGTLITERTRFLIEQRPVAAQYLKTGVCPRALQKSPDFEDVVLLARCDREGRVAGATVCDLEEALAYIESLETSWDDVDEMAPEGF